MKLVLAHVCKQTFMPSYVLLAMLPLGPLNAIFGYVFTHACGAHWCAVCH